MDFNRRMDVHDVARTDQARIVEVPRLEEQRLEGSDVASARQQSWPGAASSNCVRRSRAGRATNAYTFAPPRVAMSCPPSNLNGMFGDCRVATNRPEPYVISNRPPRSTT